jgi:hypothetical protein
MVFSVIPTKNSLDTDFLIRILNLDTSYYTLYKSNLSLLNELTLNFNYSSTIIALLDGISQLSYTRPEDPAIFLAKTQLDEILNILHIETNEELIHFLKKINKMIKTKNKQISPALNHEQFMKEYECYAVELNYIKYKMVSDKIYNFKCIRRYNWNKYLRKTIKHLITIEPMNAILYKCLYKILCDEKDSLNQHASTNNIIEEYVNNIFKTSL